jgi:predicted Fe-Mo cluster-binding NifX family protein
MERIGISHHFGRISPVFDVASSLQIFEIEERRARRGEERRLHNADVYLRAREVSACEITTLICGAVSRPLEIALLLTGVAVIAFVRGRTEEVADAFANGTLGNQAFLMPGCRRGAWRTGGPGCARTGETIPEKGGVMKIAVTSVDGSIDGAVDERFGRCRKIVVYEAGSKASSVVDNVANLNLPQGAGIQTAQNVVNAGVQAVISGHVGPKAFQVLAAAGIEVYAASSMSVAEALTRFEEGRLTKIAGADVQSHW